MRRLTMILALLASVSLGLDLPAHAANAAKKRMPAQASNPQLEELKKKLAERLKSAPAQRMRITDGRGNQLTPEEIFSHPEACKDGIHVVLGEDQLEIHGELVQSGTKGLKLYVTHLAKGNIVNGQVITIEPGMTKQAVQKRFEDALESFMLYQDAASKTGAEKRDIASVNTMGCLAIVGMAVFTAGLIAATVYSQEVAANFLPTALISLLIGGLIYFLGPEICWGSGGDVFKGG